MSEVNVKTGELTFPTLFLDGQAWEGLGEKLEDSFFARLHETNLEMLERLEPCRSARPKRRGLKSRLLRAVPAWYVTGEERYLERARDVLDFCCTADYLWAPPENLVADLRIGEMLYNVAFGFDALHPYLTREEKQQCLHTLIERGLPTYLSGIEMGDWWVKCDFNWNSALHGNAGLAALVVRNADPSLSDRVLEQVLEGLPYMIEAFYPDGGWIEGLMYCHTAVGHLTDFAVAWYRLTGDDLGLLSNEAFHDTLTWRMYMRGGDDRAYNFSDMRASRGGGLSQVYWWARMLERPDWTAHNDARLRSHRRSLFLDVESFWYRDAFPPKEEPQLEAFRHFSGIDWATWRGERTWLAFRGGFDGGNHDHDDLGNFILGIDDERFLCDPGYGPKAASRHNCITVRNKEQTDFATAPVTRSESRKNGFYLECDITGAWPHVLEHYYRHLLLLEDRHLLLLDDVLGTEETRVNVTGYFQTRLTVHRTEEGWELQAEKNRLRVIYLSKVGHLETEQWEHHGPITTLSWKNNRHRVHSAQPILLTFGDPAFSHHWEEGAFELRLNGASHRFKLGDGRYRYEGPQ